MKNLLQTLSEKLNEINKIRERHKKAKQEQKKVAPQKTKENETQKIEVDIPTKTIVKVILVLALFFILGQLVVLLKSLLVVTIICLFLAMGLSPILSSIEKYKIPRPVAILILYVGFLGVLTVLFIAIIPILSEQLFSIAREIRNLFSGNSQIPVIHDMLESLHFDTSQIQKFITDNLTSISRNLQSVAGSTFFILTGVFQGVFNFIFALVLLFFILMEREKIGNFILALIPMRDQQYIRDKAERMQSKMSDWFRGQVILMVSVGLFMYVGMKIFEFAFDMKYAATIGLLAGFMELFPYIGVILTGILASLIAVNISWVLLLFVIGWIALTQFLEGNFLVPIVMEKATGLSSVVVILAISIGGVLGNEIGGVPLAILGMILSIPLAASLGIFVDEVVKKKY
ncbi:AI-2E family transporter [Candidatus Gracilibacteria bacterium]|nr:AI-2E family transporter [Candidatus Gracilibacteria bacterium]MCF7819651.1 AI-2E family transporter [Candidatus Gracilibacteria bacterium]